MSKPLQHNAVQPSQSHRPPAERAAVVLLCVAAVLGPIALGGTSVWARLGLEAAMTVTTVLWAWSGNRSKWLLVMPVFVASATLLQLAPLPDRLLVGLAPVSAGAWKLAHEGMPLAWGCISVDPAATAAAGRRLLLGLATIAVVANLGRSLLYRRQLITAISISGILIWIVAILLPVDQQDRVILGCIDLKGSIEWWKTAVDLPIQTSGVGYLDFVSVGSQGYRADGGIVGDGFGSYICSNHFAGGLCLTLPVALAGFLYLSRGRMPNAARYATMMVFLAAALWTVGGIAQSRAGMGAMLLSSLVLLNLTVARPWLRRAAEIATVGYAAILLAFMGAMYGPFQGVDKLFPAPMQAAIASMLGDARVTAARVALRMFRASPVLGTGLDTYGDIFSRFQPGDLTLYYAHNDYAQLLAETGLVGASVAAVLVSLLLVRGHRFYTLLNPATRLLEAGPWAALAGIAAHSAFDWNLHVPANAFLASLVAGLAAATGTIARKKVTVSPSVASKSVTINAVPTPSRPNASWIIRSGLPALLAVACVGSFIFSSRDAWSQTQQRQLRKALVAARLAADPKRNPSHLSAEPQLSAALMVGARLEKWDPGNTQLSLLMGQINLHLAAVSKSKGEAELYTAAAGAWFQKAIARSAACRGLPERVLSSP